MGGRDDIFIIGLTAMLVIAAVYGIITYVS